MDSQRTDSVSVVYLSEAIDDHTIISEVG